MGLKGWQSADGGAPVLTQYFLEQVVYLNRIETNKFMIDSCALEAITSLSKDDSTSILQ